MKFKLDENMPFDLVRVLSGLGHDVDTVPQEALTGRPDSVVWACAQEAERLLIRCAPLRPWNTQWHSARAAESSLSSRIGGQSRDAFSERADRGVARLIDCRHRAENAGDGRTKCWNRRVALLTAKRLDWTSARAQKPA